MRVYTKIEEIEKEVSENTPPVIYKYRDWENDFHKTIITKCELYFAHPHNLNDPYDVRPPYKFIATQINIDEARKKIKDAGRYLFPDLTYEELEEQVELKMQSLKNEPIEYFKKNRMDAVFNSSTYDPIGVLSLCSGFDNEPMWAHYGSNHNGFAIGFKTIQLARALNCAFGLVDYDDTPLEYYIMGDNSGLFEKEIFRKSTKWRSEEELRFLTAGIGLYRDRISTFPSEAVEEIVFGLNTSEKTQEEIIAAAKQTLPGVSFYKIIVKSDAYGFDKEKL